MFIYFYKGLGYAHGISSGGEQKHAIVEAWVSHCGGFSREGEPRGSWVCGMWCKGSVAVPGSRN